MGARDYKVYSSEGFGLGKIAETIRSHAGSIDLESTAGKARLLRRVTGHFFKGASPHPVSVDVTISIRDTTSGMSSYETVVQTVDLSGTPATDFAYIPDPPIPLAPNEVVRVQGNSGSTSYAIKILEEET